MTKIRSFMFAAILLLCVSVSAFAQVPAPSAAPSSKIGWDQSAVTLAEAQQLTYLMYVDSTKPGVLLTGVTCAGQASPFQCEVVFPAFTPGAHAITLTACNLAGESNPSPFMTFTFVILPSAPSNLHIIYSVVK